MLSKIAREVPKPRSARSEQKTVQYLLEKDFDESRRVELRENLRCMNVSLRQLEISSTSTRGKKRKRKNVSWTNNPLYKKAAHDEVETDCESKNSEFSKSMDSGYKSDTASMKVDVEEGTSKAAEDQLIKCDGFRDAAEQLMQVIGELQPDTSTDESLANSLKSCEVELTKFSL